MEEMEEERQQQHDEQCSAGGELHLDARRGWRRWTAQEHELLAELVTKHGGSRSWSFIASHIPGRTGKQCRERWLNHRLPDAKRGEWTAAEEYMLAYQHSVGGSHWCRISRSLPGRTDNSVKNHWNATWRSKVMHKPQSILWLYTNELKQGSTPPLAMKRALLRWELNMPPQAVVEALGFLPTQKYSGSDDAGGEGGSTSPGGEHHQQAHHDADYDAGMHSAESNSIPERSSSAVADGAADDAAMHGNAAVQMAPSEPPKQLLNSSPAANKPRTSRQLQRGAVEEDQEVVAAASMLAMGCKGEGNSRNSSSDQSCISPAALQQLATPTLTPQGAAPLVASRDLPSPQTFGTAGLPPAPPSRYSAPGALVVNAPVPWQRTPGRGLASPNDTTSAPAPWLHRANVNAASVRTGDAPMLQRHGSRDSERSQQHEQQQQQAMQRVTVQQVTEGGHAFATPPMMLPATGTGESGSAMLATCTSVGQVLRARGAGMPTDLPGSLSSGVMHPGALQLPKHPEPTTGPSSHPPVQLISGGSNHSHAGCMLPPSQTHQAPVVWHVDGNGSVIPGSSSTAAPPHMQVVWMAGPPPGSMHPPRSSMSGSYASTTALQEPQLPGARFYTPAPVPLQTTRSVPAGAAVVPAAVPVVTTSPEPGNAQMLAVAPPGHFVMRPAAPLAAPVPAPVPAPVVQGAGSEVAPAEAAGGAPIKLMLSQQQQQALLQALLAQQGINIVLQ